MLARLLKQQSQLLLSLTHPLAQQVGALSHVEGHLVKFAEWELAGGEEECMLGGDGCCVDMMEDETGETRAVVLPQYHIIV